MVSTQKDLSVERPSSLRDQVVGNLRRGIVSGQFAPGERLVERRMCELLGVSRTLIREALRQLESEGWVRILQYRGPVVATMSHEEVLELYEVRAALEGMAALRAAERATDDELSQMEETVRTMKAAQRRGDPAVHREQVQVFYDIMRKAARNATLRAQLEAMSTRMAWLRSLTLAVPSRATIAVQEEARLLAALKARDPERARQLCEKHMWSTGQAAVAALKKSERFDDA
jgi:DNA-binding GntR family transcriptional regulator